MKQAFYQMLIIALFISSCSKKSQETTPKTVLEEAISSQYIHSGTTDKSLVVEYASYKAGADCDKAVFNAAKNMVQNSSGTNTVTVVGATLTMTFERNSNVQPAKLSLTTGSALDIAVKKKWDWKGVITLRKQNSFLSTTDFLNAVNVRVTPVNTGDVAKVLSKNAAGEIMVIEYALTTSNPSYSQAVQFDVQTSTPVTFKSQLAVNCLIPDFITPQQEMVLNISTRLAAPVEKPLGGGITSYQQEVDAYWATVSLGERIAQRYFVEKLYPTIK
ncbi:hypothetical protein [Mucilaginibacter pedocola]|uniref:Uncharacterized protein n=1 Tax=Mucilaginibacter pedocola TaxID=1792845 RepID=A0A1S9PKA1_9SPHI|nr:hypothetical protein [Mucilaginibacter pedocola]OOQ61349.1 hypothetical protein BC343_20425 [Mucilaginibacter pedocola]